jgi:hypothetical protein
MNNLIQRFFSKEKYPVIALLLLLTVFFLYMAITALSDFGGADSYWHYFITHYAFQRPWQFLDHWGKPLFTALSSPFAYFGYFGLQLFNVLASIASAYVAWCLCRKLKLQFSWLSIMLTLFAPIYFIIVFSGLTEILFGLVLILAVYLFFDEKYVWSAIVISFVTYARTEGFIFIPLFALALLYNKKWFATLFLTTGFVIYGIIGYFHYHDFFWIVTKSPYHGAQDIYGKGSLWHFVKSYREIFGQGLTGLMIFGIVGLCLPFFRKWKKSTLPITEILLIFLPVALYFAAHTYVWWKGLNGSVGLTRVIAGVIPLASVLGVKGINLVAPLINRAKTTKPLILMLICLYIVYDPFDMFKIPIPPGNEEKVFDKVYNWIEKEKPIHNKLWVLNPYLVFKLNMDPYDGTKVGLNFPWPGDLIRETKSGDLMVWDSHFGPAEGHTPLDSLMDRKCFLLKAIFLSDESFYNAQGKLFEIYVFQRTSDTAHLGNRIIMENLQQSYYKRSLLYLNTFSGTGTFCNNEKTNSCFKLSAEIEFTPSLDSVIEQCNLGNQKNFEMSADVFFTDNNPSSFVNLVAVAYFNDEIYFYQSTPAKFDKLVKNKWNHLANKFVLPEIKQKQAKLKVYLWNQNKTEMFVDNLKVEVLQIN